jgi:hypothetical protein
MISIKFLMTAAAAGAGAWQATGPSEWQLLCQALLGIVMSLAIFHAIAGWDPDGALHIGKSASERPRRRRIATH